MDIIRIKDLNIYGHHGVNAQEKDMGQIFLISLDAYLDTKKAGQSDDLIDTVSYAELCIEIEREFNKTKYNLIEKAAEELAKFILIKYEMIKKVLLEIKKPWAPIGKSLKYSSVIIERSWHDAFIAIGSNMGNKNKNIEDAIKLIDKDESSRVIKISNMYETKPVGYIEQEDFLNGAIKIETLLSPKELMDSLLKIESQLKRERIIKWGPRTIDLDIIFYDNIISYDDKVILPHPRVKERAFVLRPICDIAPYYIHPVLKMSMVELLENVEL